MTAVFFSCKCNYSSLEENCGKHGFPENT